jgi:hypothetical protein
MATCDTPINFTLFLTTLWAPTIICSLTLGSSGVRRKLSLVSEYQDFGNSTWRTATSIFGSFLLQVVGWNVVVASLLYSDPGTSDSFEDLYWLWSLRPLSASVAMACSFACPALYLENALELELVEGMMGMLLIRVYDEIRRHVELIDGWFEDTGLKRMSDGAKVGVGFWSVSLIAFLVCLCCRRSFWAFFTIWSFGWNFVRAAAGFAIWGGIETWLNSAANVNDNFCPSSPTLGAVAAISVGVTICDHIWRGMFCVARVEWISPDFAHMLSPSEKRGWPMDVTYIERKSIGTEM